MEFVMPREMISNIAIASASEAIQILHDVHARRQELVEKLDCLLNDDEVAFL
jgi:hypothetical protein